MEYNLDPNQFSRAIGATEWPAEPRRYPLVPPYKHLLIDVAILLALVVIGAAGYWFSPLLLPKADITAQPDAACDLHHNACAAAIPGGGRVELEMTPRPIPMLQPLVVKVHVSGMNATSAEIDFAGVGMNMGYNRPTLPAVAPGRFSGSASLPVCATGSMAWQATVLLETDRARIAIPFRFDSKPD